MRPTGSYDYGIVGAGLLGTSLAWYLAREKVGSVVLVEGGSRGGAGTGAGAGILSYQGWDDWDLHLVRESSAEYAALTEESGAGNFREMGGLRVARSDAGARWLGEVALALDRNGIDHDRPGAEAAASLAPWAEFDGVRAALYTPRDARFTPTELAAEYRRRAIGQGVSLVDSGAPFRLQAADPGWRMVSDSTEVRARNVVVAAGGWTASVLRGVGVSGPLAPFRAQACVVRPVPLLPEGPTLHDLDLELYARPLAPGRMLVGDGTERRATEPATERVEADSSFVASVGERLRDLGGSRARWTVERAWAGWCVATPDRFPLVGPLAGADGLYVAAGFQGMGAMRAAAVSRRLARAIASNDWASLAPADPRRFSGDRIDFLPDSEFPPSESKATTDYAGPVEVYPALPVAAEPVRYLEVGTPEAFDRRIVPSLSDWFDPFLGRFVADALLSGGRAEVAERSGQVIGVYLDSPAEEVGSVFTRSGAVAEHYLGNAPRGGVYAERAWRPGGEPITVMASDLRDWAMDEPVRNPIRLAGPADLLAVRECMLEVAGAVDDRWLRGRGPPDELCFLCECDGRIAGLSWASVHGRYARGHSFMVRPRFRGLGVGSDLLHARMLWLRAQGVQQVVSEIYDGNAASQIAAERAGMAPVATMYHFSGGGLATGR